VGELVKLTRQKTAMGWEGRADPKYGIRVKNKAPFKKERRKKEKGWKWESPHGPRGKEKGSKITLGERISGPGGKGGRGSGALRIEELKVKTL